jgi:very-short-patch-repair endonuclease
MRIATQPCSTTGCANPAAFTTRTKPAWCEPCLGEILGELGMVPVTAFPGKVERWRTRCRSCGAECDYKFDYLLELRTREEPACRRCYWIVWTIEADIMSRRRDTVSKAKVKEHLTRNGFEPVEEIVELPSGGWPIVTRCRRCGIQQAQRMGDVGWGCVCTRNGKSSNSPRTTRGAKNLFVDSENLALAWWNHDLNDASLLATVTVRAHRECHWKCPSCGHLFTAAVYWMTGKAECPKCEQERRAAWHIEWERLKVTPVADIPELLSAWADEEDPRMVMTAGGVPRRFRCKNGHHPRVPPSTFLRSGCQFCRRPRVNAPSATLAKVLPEIASQWHPTLNGKWTPEEVRPTSKRMAYWRADCCGHEWEEPVRDRNKYQRQRCPSCETILDSLGWADPGLAAEWDPANPVGPWHVRPYGRTTFTPRWICSVDPSHRWEADLSSRSNGSECPECRESGKSRVEKQHFDAAKSLFSTVKSGAFVRDAAFSTRKRWSVDILVEHRGMNVAVEYDGAYWHRPEAKMEVDRRKSRDLIAAGYRVVRLREDDLPKLGIESPHYLELQVYSTAPRPNETFCHIKEWLNAHFAC